MTIEAEAVRPESKAQANQMPKAEAAAEKVTAKSAAPAPEKAAEAQPKASDKAPEKAAAAQPNASAPSADKPKEAPRKTAAPAPAASGPGPMRRLAGQVVAGLVGGAIVLAALWWQGLLGTGTDTANQIDALQQANSAAAAGVQAMQARVEDLSGSLSGAQSELAAITNQAAALQEKLTALEAGQDQLKTGLQGAEAALNQAATSDQFATAGEQLADLGGQVTALQQQLTDAVSALATGAQSPEATAAAPAQIAALREQIQAQILAELSPQVEALMKNVADARVEMSAATAALEAEFAQVTARAERAVVRRSNLLVAYNGLKEQVEGGLPFADNLAVLTKAGLAHPILGQLQPLAASGLATPASLIEQIAALPVEAPPASDAAAQSWTDRLLSGAQSLVKVTPIEQGGADSAAGLAQIVDAVQAGDWAGALSRWAALPGEVQAAGAAIATQLTIRSQLPAFFADVEGEVLADRLTVGETTQ